ncbi:phosphoribosylanthranilate isomerase [Floricoccus penangensis]|uniref:phosphoribosylanthranilate isomerase n=1 Tax=Floricoccus penangensis TaxID=1859475 RepID=UPI0020418C34|nr:phosphoribosylanthranilate isomerase [Floricoccus penangensis]URZ88072.1 phosphoribosylanthranilate isomerase [Floricoccus penangensis]
MIIKTCGLRTKEAVDCAVASGATHLGFILSESKRQITPRQLIEITKDVPSNVKKVGVFVNEDIDFVNDIANQAGLDIVQLHGQEDVDYIRKIIKPVIKSFDDYKKIYYYDLKDMTILLDSSVGGSGQRFDWNSLPLEQIEAKFILAGGLNPENVVQAMELFGDKILGVDVSSGIETDGVKDLAKIKSFIERTKNYDVF